jgi:hypothetical protein
MNRKTGKKGPAAALAPEENARTGPAKTEYHGLQGAFGLGTPPGSCTHQGLRANTSQWRGVIVVLLFLQNVGEENHEESSEKDEGLQ